MARIFISFLGLGNPRTEFGYDLAKYNWPGKCEDEVEVYFAQTAILKFLEESRGIDGAVDRVVFLCTEQSRKRLPLLEAEMKKYLAVPPNYLVPRPYIPTDMKAENQWGWFEQLLGIIDHNDSLILDFTHGMRPVPIVFSSAIGFLRRAKNITLSHALYAWYDQNDKDRVHPIVDMRGFYVINDWTESVSRLTDDADVRQLAQLAGDTEIEPLKPLADPGLVRAFQEMTDCIRNVDVNNITAKVSGTLKMVQAARENASGSAKVMLDLVWEKFSTLASNHPLSGRYDAPYFESQLRIIEVLLEHRLFMQAFTAMREMVGSLGMVGVTGKYRKNMRSSKGKKYRRIADVFINMLQFPETKWDFSNQAQIDKEMLKDWYRTLQETGIEQQLRKIVTPMVATRNGFDHAWTSKTSAHDNIQEEGQAYLITLKTVVDLMANEKLFEQTARQSHRIYFKILNKCKLSALRIFTWIRACTYSGPPRG
nr:TIGR02221 family CRISPR-associated protein [uncultured Desulfobulbus sp.]